MVANSDIIGMKMPSDQKSGGVIFIAYDSSSPKYLPKVPIFID